MQILVMRYKSGFLNSLFRNKIVGDTHDRYLLCQTNGTSILINYLDIKHIVRNKGFFGDKMLVEHDNTSTLINGLSRNDLLRLHRDIAHQAKKILTLSLVSVSSQVEETIREMLEGDRYLSNRDVRRWINEFPDIVALLTHFFFDPEHLPDQHLNTFLTALEIMKPDSSLVKERNKQYVDRNMEQYKSLFGFLEKYPLTNEQIRAAIIDEDRNLLIAAAGSGKTSAIVAKVIYLIAKGLAKTDEMLVLTYSKKSQNDIDNKLVDKCGIVKSYQTPVKSKTFHTYAGELITRATGKAPSVAEIASKSKERRAKLFDVLIEELYKNDEEFAAAWQEYILFAKFTEPQSKFITESKYSKL